MKLTINYNNCYVCAFYRQSIALLKQRTGEYFVKKEVYLIGRILINDERSVGVRCGRRARLDETLHHCCAVCHAVKSAVVCDESTGKPAVNNAV